MRHTFLLMTLASALAATGCKSTGDTYGGGGGGVGARQDWSSTFEGTVLDARGFPSGDVFEPVSIELTPVGRSKYAVRFAGELDFPMFDPYWNVRLGTFHYDLWEMDGQTGDYFAEHALNPFGAFDFWGGNYYVATGLGETWVDVWFTLYPLDGDLCCASEADLEWHAEFYSAGGAPGLLESVSTLSGSTTIALRVN